MKKKGNLVVYTWAPEEQYNMAWHFNTTHENWGQHDYIVMKRDSTAVAGKQFEFFGYNDKVAVYDFFESLFGARKIEIGYER
jgi:hypothetical protein